MLVQVIAASGQTPFQDMRVLIPRNSNCSSMMVDIVSIQTALCSHRDSYSAEQGHARRGLAIVTELLQRLHALR